MKNLFLSVLALVFAFGLGAQEVLTCHDVQYTTDPGGASPYSGDVVTVEGIVVSELFYTGTSTSNYGFMISDPEGGPWSGLLIFTNQYHPQRGDLVQVTGTITEYYDFTEMSPTTGFQVLSQGNPLPPATPISTGDLLSTSGDAEQWEGVFVKVETVQITNTPNNYNEFYVSDGSGAAQIDDQCFPRSGFSWPQMSVGQNWARIQGVVDYSFSYFAINPRDMNDIIQVDDVSNAIVKIQTTTAEIDTPISVDVLTSRLKPEWYVSSYTARIKIDPDKVLFHGVDTEGTLSVLEPEYEVSAAGDTIEIVYMSQEPITSDTDDEALFKLLLEPTSYGETIIELLSFSYDNTSIGALNNGKLLTPIRK
ncbi:MAG: metallophosphoesterase, partial [Candidatus Syntrophosphaera sp.]